MSPDTWQRARVVDNPRLTVCALLPATELWVRARGEVQLGVASIVNRAGEECTGRVYADPEAPERGLYPTHYVDGLGRTIYVHASAVELLGRSDEDFRADVERVEWPPPRAA